MVRKAGEEDDGVFSFFFFSNVSFRWLGMCWGCFYFFYFFFGMLVVVVFFVLRKDSLDDWKKYIYDMMKGIYTYGEIRHWSVVKMENRTLCQCLTLFYGV